MFVDWQVAGEAEIPIGHLLMFASASSVETLAITSGATKMQVFPAGSFRRSPAGTLFNCGAAPQSKDALNRFKYRNE